VQIGDRWYDEDRGSTSQRTLSFFLLIMRKAGLGVVRDYVLALCNSSQLEQAEALLARLAGIEPTCLGVNVDYCGFSLGEVARAAVLRDLKGQPSMASLFKK